MFAKVFGQIFDSSIAEDYNCRRMFMDLLVLADPTGAVDMTFEAVARRTNVPLEEVRQYITQLCQPDPASRSQLEEGKRLTPLDDSRDWGWQIVNYKHYRNLRDKETLRNYFKQAQRDYRAKKRGVKDNGLTESDETGQRLTTPPEEEEDKKKRSVPTAPTQTIVWSRAEGWGGIESKDLEGWKETYPACDIQRQLKAMHEWLASNPAKAVKRNWRRFITNWLSRKQDRGGDIPSSRPASSERKLTPFEIKEKLKAIEDELGRDYWKREQEHFKTRRATLIARKKELQRMLTE